VQFIYRALGRYLAKNPHVVGRLLDRAYKTPYTHIDGYMNRWWLFNPYQGADGSYRKRNWFMNLLPSIRIHHILREDDDRDYHDHPWDAQTIILGGWYDEERPSPQYKPTNHIVPQPGTLRFTRRVGDTARLRFGEYHRIDQVSPLGVLTLFITFKYRGVWGFLVDGVKVPWREYLARKNGSQQ
jgi:hypothetical protein